MYRVEVKHSHDFVFKVKTGKDEFTVDAKGEGLTPLDAFLSGLGTCVGVFIRKYAEGAKLPLDNFDIIVEAELEKAPLCFKLIKVDVDLKNAPIDERRKPALLEFIKNCPAHGTLKGNPEIQVKLI